MRKQLEATGLEVKKLCDSAFAETSTDVSLRIGTDPIVHLDFLNAPPEN